MVTVNDAANQSPHGRLGGPGLGKSAHKSALTEPGRAVDVPRQGAAKAGGDLPDGLSLEDYASRSSLSESEIWRLLRRGDLVGKSEKGRLIIYKSLESGSVAVPAPESAASVEATCDLADLPPLPKLTGDGPGRAGAESERQGSYLTLSGDRSGSPELALLLDHLSLAKEENREILRMTQESIRKVSELTDTIVQMKDSVIESKESQILALKEQIAAREDEMKRLRQQNEDLEMLARAVATTTPPRAPRR